MLGGSMPRQKAYPYFFFKITLITYKNAQKNVISVKSQKNMPCPFRLGVLTPYTNYTL